MEGLATRQLRRLASQAYRDAVESVQPRNVLHGLDPARWSDGGGRRVLVALGKAAPGLAAAWLKAHPGWADQMLVLTPHGVPVPEPLRQRTVLRGGHPLPDADGLEAAVTLRRLVSPLGSRDTLLVLLSGGASALLAEPIAGVTLSDLRSITCALLAAGAPIEELNAVRRHLLTLAGGGLARAAAPATVITAVLSDVLTDRWCDIASGPTVTAPEGPRDAVQTLVRWHVDASPVAGALRQLPQEVAPVPAPDPLVLANNRTALIGAQASLERAGVRVMVASKPVTGEASVRGRWLGAVARFVAGAPSTALMAGAETTVAVRGRGRGGRNQELALAAAIELADCPGRILLAAGSDGIDGASDHAGAVVDGGTVARCRAEGIEPTQALADNDSATALAASGDALVTGPTGTNVCDLVILLAADSGGAVAMGV